MEKKENRGGARPNAGRKRLAVRKKVFTTRISPAAIERLELYAKDRQMSMQDALDEILTKANI